MGSRRRFNHTLMIKKIHVAAGVALVLLLMIGLPVSGQEESIRFAVIGDYGLAGAGTANVAEMVMSWEPDVILTLGDNNYPSGSAETIDENIGQYYSDFIFPYHGRYGPGGEVIRFFPVLGNHDWQTASAQPYLDYFTLPGNERYYEFVYGSVHFFALDADFNEPDGVSMSSTQAEWLQTVLADSTSPWQVVYMHMPPYSSGQHGSHEVMQWPYAEWGADAVLAGHDHIYERIVLDGLAYFVNGVGGTSITAFNTPVEGSVARYNAAHGAMLVEATREQMDFWFYSVYEGGTLIDSYTLHQ
jgi:tartrate-resistant acid phosphatase type 5